MRSERRKDDGSGYRPFDFDQTVLTVLGQYKLTNTWEVGARFNTVLGVLKHRSLDPCIILIQTATRVSRENRIVRVCRLTIGLTCESIAIGFLTWILSAYFEIQNVYNRANPERLNPNYDFTTATYSSGLPIIPSIGVRGQF